MKVQRLSADARVALFRAATAEATRRGDRYIGTELLLLGLLADSDGAAEHALGISLEAARAGLDRLDREALGTIGVDSHPATSTGRSSVRRHLPFTSGAKRAIVRAVRHATRPARDVHLDSSRAPRPTRCRTSRSRRAAPALPRLRRRPHPSNVARRRRLTADAHRHLSPLTRTSRNGSSRSTSGSRGSPRIRSPMMLRWIWSVPPPIDVK